MATMMREASISFPLLGDWSIDPPASFQLFGRTFYFYGAIIALGFILAAWYCSKRAKRFGMTEDDLFSLILWVLPIAVVGARIYFVIFQWQDFKNDLVSILYVWNGGLAIYGGVLAGALTAVIWCRVKKIPAGAALDLLAFGVLIGQIAGRWGNFMNREAFGAVTDAFCRMGLTMPGQETVYVHPTFLYESLWNLVGFFLLSLFVRKGRRKYDGQVFLLYVLWYGLGRAWIEGLRTDSLYIAGTALRASQCLAAASALIAAALLIINARRAHPTMYVDRPAVTAEETADGAEQNKN